MSINIILDFKIFFVKSYSLNKQNRNFINQKFDKLHRKKKSRKLRSTTISFL